MKKDLRQRRYTPKPGVAAWRRTPGGESLPRPFTCGLSSSLSRRRVRPTVTTSSHDGGGRGCSEDMSVNLVGMSPGPGVARCGEAASLTPGFGV